MLASMRDNEAGVMVVDTICLLGDIEPRVGRVETFSLRANWMDGIRSL